MGDGDLGHEPADIAKRLAQLADLHQQGVLNDAEYEAAVARVARSLEERPDGAETKAGQEAAEIAPPPPKPSGEARKPVSPPKTNPLVLAVGAGMVKFQRARRWTRVGLAILLVAVVAGLFLVSRPGPPPHPTACESEMVLFLDPNTPYMQMSDANTWIDAHGGCPGVDLITAQSKVAAQQAWYRGRSERNALTRKGLAVIGILGGVLIFFAYRPWDRRVSD